MHFDKTSDAAWSRSTSCQRSVIARIRQSQTWPDRQPPLFACTIEVDVAFRPTEAGPGPEGQTEKVLQAKWRGDLKVFLLGFAYGDRRRRFWPEPQRISRRSVGRIVITNMHPALIFNRPANIGIEGSQPILQGPILGRLSAVRIEPDHVQVAGWFRWRCSVQVIPDRVPDKPGTDPAVRHMKHVNEAEDA